NSPSWGMEWKVQSWRPVRTSKPRTSPGGISFWSLKSSTEPPQTITSPQTTGGGGVEARFPLPGRPRALRRARAPAAPETGDRAAGGCVEGNQVGILCSHEDAALTLTVPPGAFPEGDAAVDIAVGVGVEHPAGLAGASVDGGDLVQPGRNVEDAVHHDWRGFVRAGAVLRVLPRQGVVRRVPAPGDPQLRHVGAVDLGQRRVLGAPRIPAIGRPLPRRNRLRRRRARPGGRRGGDDPEQAEKDEQW